MTPSCQMAYSRIFLPLGRLNDEDVSVLHTDVNAVTVIFISRTTPRMLCVFLAGNFIAALPSGCFIAGRKSIRNKHTANHCSKI